MILVHKGRFPFRSLRRQTRLCLYQKTQAGEGLSIHGNSDKADDTRFAVLMESAHIVIHVCARIIFVF